MQGRHLLANDERAFFVLSCDRSTFLDISVQYVYSVKIHEMRVIRKVTSPLQSGTTLVSEWRTSICFANLHRSRDQSTLFYISVCGVSFIKRPQNVSTTDHDKPIACWEDNCQRMTNEGLFCQLAHISL